MATAANVDWEAALQAARVDLIEGRFASAVNRLKPLVRSAPSPVERARAEELLQLSHEWLEREVVVVVQQELAGTDLESRRSDLRTSDEIGVLYLSSIVYGLGTGLLIDLHAEPDSVAGAILPPLLAAGAAAGGVAVMDSGTGLRYGTAQSISTGMSVGFCQGLAWGTYFQATSSYSDQMEEETYATMLWGTATAGAVAGGVIGSVNSTTPGRAAFVGSATLWPAVVFGLGAGGLNADDEYRDDNALLASAFGASIGTLGGVLAAGEVSPTTARVRFLDLGAIGGGLAVGGLAMAIRGEDTEDGSEIFLATDLGIVAGLGLAWWLTDDMPRDLGAKKRQTGKATITPSVMPQLGGMGLGAVGTF